jgi:3-phenylpropionate/trans-cinnamate dioxygenase ferredoxin reductase component
MSDPGMVIVGGGMAGARAVIALRVADYAGPITLIGEEQILPYDRPPLSKAAITSDEEPTPAWLLDDDQLNSLKATFFRDAKAVALDRVEKTVTLSNGHEVPYRKLLIATGAKPRALTCPGGEHALTLRILRTLKYCAPHSSPAKKSPLSVAAS